MPFKRAYSLSFMSMFQIRVNNSLVHFMTGSDRHYRGRKLGLAIKLLAIRYAKQHNFAYLYTNNDSQNAPMLAINVKLGYQRLNGNYMLVKTFDQGPT